MNFQINIALESQFLFYYIAVILGIQISLYSIYHYFKTQDKDLKLNRILLSFGAFALLTVFGAFFLVIVRLFELDSNSETVLSKIGFATVFLAPIGFEIFIVREEFSKILNLKTCKILMIMGLLPVVAVVILPTESLIFRISIVFMVLNSLYIILIQIRLIKISVGNIKIRLKQFLTGEVLALTALVFAAQVSFSFLPLPTETSYFIGIGFLISGFSIIFLAEYNFPPFYEFYWRENLLRFFIINQKNNSILYESDFYKSEIDETEDNLSKIYFSGGLMGLENIISTITFTKDEKLKIIKHGDASLLLEYTTDYPIPIIYALVVKRDLNSFRYIIRTLKTQFESFFKDILIVYDKLKVGANESQLFKSFDEIVDNIIND